MTTKMMEEHGTNLKFMEKKDGNVVTLYNTLEKDIDEFLLEKRKWSEATYVNYRSDFKKLAEEMFGYDEYKYIRKDDLEGLSVDDLIHYFNTCYQEDTDDGKRKYSNGTINRRMSSLKSLIKHLAGRRKIDYDINELYHLKTLPDDADMIDVLSDDDADKCIEHFKTFSSGNILYRLGNLAVDTALRINELLTLEWNQFTILNENEVLIKSRGKRKGKGNKDWEKVISTEQYKELLFLKKEDENKVFNISYSSVTKYMYATIRDLGLDKDGKKYTFHSFRKNSVTFNYNITKDIVATMNHANHSSTDTTLRYIKVNNYGATGRKSLAGKVDNNAYMKASHEELLSVLSKMDKSLLFQLNKELSNAVESVIIDKDII